MMVRRWRKRSSHSREAEWCSHFERQFGAFLWSKTVLKNYTSRYWHMVLEKALESPLNSKEIKLVHPKGNQPWIFIGRTHAEAEVPTLWPPDVKNWLIGKDPDAGKDWRQEKGVTEDEMVGWHHWCDGHEFESTPGLGDGQGGLVSCSPWGRRVGPDLATERQQQYWQKWSENVCPHRNLHVNVFSSFILYSCFTVLCLVAAVQNGDSVTHVCSVPLRFVTGHWTWFPVLHSRTALFFHPVYTSLHLLIPAPDPPLPPPPPWEPQVCALSLCVSVW